MVFKQSEARHRILGAKVVRNTGLGLLAVGVSFPLGFRSRGIHGTVPVHLPGLTPFEAPMRLVLGAIVGIVGIVTFVVGLARLYLALEAARRDPITNEVFRRAGSLEPEWPGEL